MVSETELAEPEYSTGDDVFVIDPNFEPVVQRGTVGVRGSDVRGRSIDVGFDRDPYDRSRDEPRLISADPDQVVHADAGMVEVYQLLGLEGLIEDTEINR